MRKARDDMTLDEHIAKAEEDAKMAKFDTEWGIGNYFIDRAEALEYAKECENLVNWLKDYKRLLEQEPCEDCISREDAINCVTAASMCDPIITQRRLKSLPSVQPKTKTGHWIAYEVQLPDRVVLNYHCSVCGRKLVGYSTETLKDAPYCHCGARMEG